MDILFEIEASNSIVVRTTKAYWEKIVKLKHPSMRSEVERVKLTLTDPEEIRQSKKAKNVLLYCVSLRVLHDTASLLRLISGVIPAKAGIQGSQ